MSKINSVSSLIETKYVSLFDVRYTNKTGNEKQWTVASRKDKETLEGIYLNNKKDKIDAVIISAYHKDEKKLVIIKEFRVPINKYILELPAGLVDSDDNNFEDAVRRELKEETGLDLVSINLQKSHDQVYLSPGMTDESVAFVNCICEGTISREFLEEDEDIEAILVSKEEALKYINNKEAIDVRAYLTLQSFALLGETMFL